MLPRRAVVAIATTAVAMALLLNFKTPSGQVVGATSAVVGQPAAPAVVTPGAAAGSGAGQTGAASGASSSAAPQVTPQSTSQAQSGAQAPSTPQAQSTPQARGTALKTGRYSGPVVQIPFGNVQVQITVQGGKIVDVQPIQLPTAHMMSQQIGQYAAPILRQEALQAQSAQIDLVSGATYTSEAYAQSLQGALDQAVA